MEEGLFLDRIALEGSHILGRDEESPVSVVSHLADSRKSAEDDATVSASGTADPLIGKFLIKFSFPGALV
jgi:hypothetical protein